MKLNFDGNKKINIPLTTLDSFKENITENNLIIKIDVEGYEKEVIDGAKLILNKTKNVILIIELLEENNGLSMCEQITLVLKENDFEYIYKIKDNDLLKVSSFEGSADYIFIKGIETKNSLDKILNRN